jgi:hypothetical protein
MTYAQLRRPLGRRLPELLGVGAAIEVYEGDRPVFREVVDRAFRLERGGEQAALLLWFRPVGEPEWEPRIGGDAYPIERARCLLVDEAIDNGDALSLDGPTGPARITPLHDQPGTERFGGWISFREIWLTPEEEATLDELRG